MTIYATPGPGAGDWVIIGVAIVCAAVILWTAYKLRRYHE